MTRPYHSSAIWNGRSWSALMRSRGRRSKLDVLPGRTTVPPCSTPESRHRARMRRDGERHHRTTHCPGGQLLCVATLPTGNALRSGNVPLTAPTNWLPLEGSSPSKRCRIRLATSHRRPLQNLQIMAVDYVRKALAPAPLFCSPLRPERRAHTEPLLFSTATMSGVSGVAETAVRHPDDLRHRGSHFPSPSRATVRSPARRSPGYTTSDERRR